MPSPRQILASLRPQTAPASTSGSGAESPEVLSPVTPPGEKSAPAAAPLPRLQVTAENKSAPAVAVEFNVKNVFKNYCTKVKKYYEFHETALLNNPVRSNELEQIKALKKQFKHMRDNSDQLEDSDFQKCVTLLEDPSYKKTLANIGMPESALSVVTALQKKHNSVAPSDINFQFTI